MYRAEEIRGTAAGLSVTWIVTQSLVKTLGDPPIKSYRGD